MLQLGHVQRNVYHGEINNSGGTLVAGGIFNAENVFFGSRPVDAAQKGELDLLKREGLCVLSLCMYIRIYAATMSFVPSFSSSLSLTSVDSGGVSGLSTLYVLRALFPRLNAKRGNSASNIFCHLC
jgi:hypothetical protein